MVIKTKVVVLVENKDKILLLKEWSNKRNGYFWNLIKGTFGDHSNETLEDCAKREALEETGLNIAIENLISCYVAEEDNLRIQFNFLAHPINEDSPKITNKLEQQARGEDVVEAVWFTKKELSKITPQEFIHTRIHKVIEDYFKDKRYSLEVIPKL